MEYDYGIEVKELSTPPDYYVVAYADSSDRQSAWYWPAATCSDAMSKIFCFRTSTFLDLRNGAGNNFEEFAAVNSDYGAEE